MKLLLAMALMIPLCLMAAPQAPVVLKKGQIISCPANHKPMYKLTESLREGEAIRSDMVVYHDTGKKPEKLNVAGLPAGFACDSVVMTWRGACIHTNQGWKPDACQVGLRVKLEFETVVE